MNKKQRSSKANKYQLRFILSLVSKKCLEESSKDVEIRNIKNLPSPCNKVSCS